MTQMLQYKIWITANIKICCNWHILFLFNCIFRLKFRVLLLRFSRHSRRSSWMGCTNLLQTLRNLKIRTMWSALQWSLHFSKWLIIFDWMSSLMFAITLCTVSLYFPVFSPVNLLQKGPMIAGIPPREASDRLTIYQVIKDECQNFLAHKSCKWWYIGIGRRVLSIGITAIEIIFMNISHWI